MCARVGGWVGWAHPYLQGRQDHRLQGGRDANIFCDSALLGCCCCQQPAARCSCTAVVELCPPCCTSASPTSTPVSPPAGAALRLPSDNHSAAMCPPAGETCSGDAGSALCKAPEATGESGGTGESKPPSTGAPTEDTSGTGGDPPPPSPPPPPECEPELSCIKTEDGSPSKKLCKEAKIVECKEGETPAWVGGVGIWQDGSPCMHLSNH